MWRDPIGLHTPHRAKHRRVSSRSGASDPAEALVLPGLCVARAPPGIWGAGLGDLRRYISARYARRLPTGPLWPTAHRTAAQRAVIGHSALTFCDRAGHLRAVPHGRQRADFDFDDRQQAAPRESMRTLGSVVVSTVCAQCIEALRRVVADAGCHLRLRIPVVAASTPIQRFSVRVSRLSRFCPRSKFQDHRSSAP